MNIEKCFQRILSSLIYQKNSTKVSAVAISEIAQIVFYYLRSAKKIAIMVLPAPNRS